jgi:guanylate cyclase
MIRTFIKAVASLGFKPNDPDNIKQGKRIIVGSSLASGSAALVWGLIYFINGEKIGGAIPLLGGMFFFLYLPVFVRTGNINQLKFITFLIWLIVPSSAMWFLGGFYSSSVMIIWSLIAVILALMTSTLKDASRWFFAYLLILVISGIIQPFLSHDSPLQESLIISFFVVNLGVISVIIFFALRFFIVQRNEAYSSLEREQEKSENLLLNVLPREIAEILKERDQIIAQSYGEASVIFADLVGFTPLTELMTPKEMIALLNEIYSQFDQLVDEYGLEKIRTIGDNYMIVSGVPKPRNDHAEAAAKLALEIMVYADQLPDQNGHKIKFRIGMNAGPLIAGVIGKKKFHYDVWGDTVNTASRMESHGLPGKIQVTDHMYRLLKDEFIFEPRGEIDVKGKGVMETWLLIGKKEPTPSPEP